MTDLPRADDADDAGDDVLNSTLPAAGFTAVTDAGFEPAGFVMGSSVCHIGLPGSAGQRGGIAYAYPRVGELTAVSEAVRVAKDAATQRLADDTRRLDADGVAGVGMTIRYASWARDAIEIVLTGTALRRSGGSPAASRGPDAEPFVSGLSGQDLRTLLRSGYRPAGIVLGCCVYRAAAEGDAYNKWLGNRELPTMTGSLSTVRERAMLRMQDDAVRQNAAGVVGVRLDQHRWRQPMVIEYRAVGTAVVPLDDPPAPVPPVSVLSLGT